MSRFGQLALAWRARLKARLRLLLELTNEERHIMVLVAAIFLTGLIVRAIRLILQRNQ